METKLVSIVMPVRNNKKITQDCLDSIFQNSSMVGEVILIDDHSTESLADLKSVGGIASYYLNKGEGVNSAWNYGASLAKFPYICWVNNDILFTPEWDVPIIVALDDETWIVSPYHTYGELPSDFPMGLSKKRNMDGQSTGLPFLGSCFMMKKDNWEKVGPIDERLKLWSGDNYIYERTVHDFGKKAREISESYIHHFGSKTIDRSGIAESLSKDMETFGLILQERHWL